MIMKYLIQQFNSLFRIKAQNENKKEDFVPKYQQEIGKEEIPLKRQNDGELMMEKKKQLLDVANKMLAITETIHDKLMDSYAPNLSEISSEFKKSMEEVSTQINAFPRDVKEEFFSSKEGSELMEAVNSKLKIISMVLSLE